MGAQHPSTRRVSGRGRAEPHRQIAGIVSDPARDWARLQDESVGTTTPTFQWLPYPGATSYEVVLIQLSPARQAVIGLDSGGQVSTPATSYTLDFALVPGARYSLLVWASDSGGQIAVGNVYFQVQ